MLFGLTGHPKFATWTTALRRFVPVGSEAQGGNRKHLIEAVVGEGQRERIGLNVG